MTRYCSSYDMNVWSPEEAAGLRDRIKSERVIAFAVPLSADPGQAYTLEAEIAKAGWWNGDYLAPGELFQAAFDLDGTFRHGNLTGHLVSRLVTAAGKPVRQGTVATELQEGMRLVLEIGLPAGAERDALLAQVRNGDWQLAVALRFNTLRHYALSKDGVTSLVPRDRHTAHLSRACRAYGGTGLHEGARLGRALSWFDFAVSGLVPKPQTPTAALPKPTESVPLAPSPITSRPKPAPVAVPQATPAPLPQAVTVPKARKGPSQLELDIANFFACIPDDDNL